jgi:lysophospholipase L1-like esterase
MALLNLQTFAKANNFKIVLANAFNQRQEGIYEWLKEYAGKLVDQFDWSCYIHNDIDYVAFMEKLVELDGKLPREEWGAFNDVYNPKNLDTHSEYLTNDQGAHPTIKGYRVIADELATFIKKRGYIEESLIRQP